MVTEQRLFEIPMDEQQLTSVTTALGVLEKPGLLYWAAEKAARAAIEHDNYWHSIQDLEGDAEAIKWLANARFRHPKDELAATQLGTAVHEACEIIILDGKPPAQMHPSVEPFIKQFQIWLDIFQPRMAHCEIPIYNPEVGYAGTADSLGFMGKKRCLFDYKSTKKSFDSRGRPTKPYIEASLQLTAYKYGELMQLEGKSQKIENQYGRKYIFSDEIKDNCVPLPLIDDCIIIHITPEHCNAHTALSGPASYAIFKDILSVAKARETKEWKQAIGNVLPQP